MSFNVVLPFRGRQFHVLLSCEGTLMQGDKLSVVANFGDTKFKGLESVAAHAEQYLAEKQ